MSRGATRWFVLGLLAAAVGAGVVSCTPEERHQVLTFFFDGVPPLGGERPEDETDTAAARLAAATQPVKVVTYEHGPGVDKKQCARCHDYAVLRKPKNTLCTPCHQKEMQAYPRMHGPVAIGDCAACHDAHESQYPHVVLGPLDRLCFTCHEPMSKPGGTAGCPRTSDSVNCSQCHHPHGGTDRFFLVARTDEDNRREAAAEPAESEADEQ